MIGGLIVYLYDSGQWRVVAGVGSDVPVGTALMPSTTLTPSATLTPGG